MPWLYLLLAAACEMIWPIGFKYTAGFTRNVPMIALTMALLLTSFILMMLATRDPRMHVGTAYAVWTGLGAAGTVVLGIILLHEPRDLGRLLCLGLIIAGVIGLKLVSGEASAHSPAAPANQEAIDR